MKQIGNIYFIAAIAVIGEFMALFGIGPTVSSAFLLCANIYLQAVAFSALIFRQ